MLFGKMVEGEGRAERLAFSKANRRKKGDHLFFKKKMGVFEFISFNPFFI